MKTEKLGKDEIIPMETAAMLINRENIYLYVEMFKLWARKSAESVLGLARTLVEAEEGLTEGEFEIFCEEVGIEKGGLPTRNFT